MTMRRSAQARSFRAGLARQPRSAWATWGPALLFDVLPQGRQRRTTGRRGEVGRRPEMPVHTVPVHPAGELVPEPPRRDTFEAVHQLGDGHLRWVVDKQADVIVFAVELDQFGAEVAAHVTHDLFASGQDLVGEDTAPVLSYENQVNVKRRYHAPATSVVVLGNHRPSVECGCAASLQLPALPQPRPAAGVGEGVRVRSGGVQRWAACTAGS